MRDFNFGWYLIYTKPRHEKKVAAQLIDNEVDHFLPTRKTLRHWHDRRKYVDEPLFPSYIFVYIKDLQSYHIGINAEGALYYVKDGKDMARVSDSIVNNIKLVAGKAADVEVSDERFQPGTRYVIREGALTGLACEMIRYNNRDTLLVRVDLLQRSLLLSISPEHLIQPISQ